jgi:uncharacterized protein YqeY
MATLKDTLQTALTDAIRARDEVATATLRMALAAITTEEVAGKVAKDLTDDQTIAVLSREAKKRREAAEAYDGAERPELAARERAELAVLEGYLPQQLSDEEIDGIVAAAVAQATSDGATGGRAMGAVMKLVTPQVAGRADGSAVAAKVKAALGLG